LRYTGRPVAQPAVMKSDGTMEYWNCGELTMVTKM
jgi:hypothetical protein